jgi:hypothetical protein
MSEELSGKDDISTYVLDGQTELISTELIHGVPGQPPHSQSVTDNNPNRPL